MRKKKKKGWLPRLWAIVATCYILQEAEKVIPEKPNIVFLFHQVLTLLEQKGGHYLTAGYMEKYQAI